MNIDELCKWLREGRGSQRDKLTTIEEHYLDVIVGMYDDEHARAVREIKKRLNSPKLAAGVTALVARLVGEHNTNPNPEPLDAPVPETESPPMVVDNPGDPGAVLEAAIAAEPTTRDSYIVYGDWLEGRSDPRGQLVAIGAELAKAPEHKAMLAAHAEHLRAHGDTILGVLAKPGVGITGIEWFMGFISKARVGLPRDRDRKPAAFAIPEVLQALLDDPGPGRFVQDLTLGLVKLEGDGWQAATLAIAKRPRRALRKLFIGDFTYEECELNWTKLGDLSKLWPAVPNLRELTLRSGSMTIGPIDLPKLESLTTITGGLGEDSAERLAAANWPELRTLSLQVGRRDCGAAQHVASVAPLLTGARAPKLTALGIVNCEFVDEIVELLVDAPLLSRLTSLDLSLGTMTDDGARVIERNASKFTHLFVNVDDNYLTEEACARLAACVPNLYTGDQREDDGHRYASTVE